MKQKKSFASAPVFIISSCLIFFFVGISAIFPSESSLWLKGAQQVLVKHTSWLYILAVGLIFLTMVYLAFSRYGELRLGPEHSQPKFSYPSWFAMLFSAGMGIGIMFFGVAEPVMHFVSPPVGEGQTIDAAKEALNITFFHWGLHAWAIYALVGLILAYFSYRQNLPLTLRSALYPLIGKRIWGPIGHAFDIFAILGAVFGVAASLGYGVTQIGSGIEAVFGWPSSTAMHIFLIIVVSCIATLSAVSGVDKGIKRLSEVNLFLALGLLALVLFVGPTDLLLKAFLQNTGNYLSGVVNKTFNLYAYDPTDWMGGWTLLYWGWWLSWSPFVGMFIARISYGRTIREFIFGVMLVPSLFNFLWMTVFGNSAIDLILNKGHVALANDVQNDVASSLFSFLGYFPASSITSFVAIFMIVVFFVTSADSGALVVNLLASGGKEKNPTWQKVYWSMLIGLMACVVFIAGGLEALQTVTILSALPFSIILLCAAYGLKKALDVDYLKRMSIVSSATSSPFIDQDNWKRRIESIVKTPKAGQVVSFMTTLVVDSLNQVSNEFIKQGLQTDLVKEKNSIALIILHDEEIDFKYQVCLREYEPPSFTIFNNDSAQTNDSQRNYYRAEIFLKEGGQNYDIMGYTKEQIIADVIEQYQRHLHFLSLIRNN